MDARQANDRIAEKAERLRFVSRVPMLCECSDRDCRAVVMVRSRGLPRDPPRRGRLRYRARPCGRRVPPRVGDAGLRRPPRRLAPRRRRASLGVDGLTRNAAGPERDALPGGERADRAGRRRGSSRDDAHVYEFLCECSNSDCTLLLPLTIAEYEAVRSDSRQFIVAPGHDLPEIEEVVARNAGYQVVRKQGEAAEFVTERDPRS